MLNDHINGLDISNMTDKGMEKEVIDYSHPFPQWARPVRYINPALDEPTFERRQDYSAGTMSPIVTAESDEGIQFPTADSSMVKEEPTMHTVLDRDGTNFTVENTIIEDRAVNLNYNKGNLEALIFDINAEDYKIRKMVANTLNELFPLSNCKRVIYTNNIDKPFFGLRCYRELSPNDIPLMSATTSYSIEFDSKLFDPVMSLSQEEISAMVIYTIYHSIFSQDISDTVVREIEEYTMLNNITNINSIPAKTLLAFAMNDALMKAGNPFLKDNISELVNDPLIVHFGYSAEMEYGMRKIADNFDFIKQYADNRFIVLSWALRVIDDYEHMRFHAYKRLTDCLELTGSVLEKENINDVIRVLQTTSYMTESELYYYGEANGEEKSDIPLYRLSDVKTKIVNLKADVMASIDITSVSDNLKTIWELIKVGEMFNGFI